MLTASHAEKSAVSTFRLYVLRSIYLLIGVGLAATIWPGIIQAPPDLPHVNTAVRSLLGALSLLALVGIRYPLKMLPLLLFELVWKAIWLIAFALPRWTSGGLDATMQGELPSFLITVLVLSIAIPWRYVLAEYVKQPGERWTSKRTASTT